MLATPGLDAFGGRVGRLAPGERGGSAVGGRVAVPGPERFPDDVTKSGNECRRNLPDVS